MGAAVRTPTECNKFRLEITSGDLTVTDNGWHSLTGGALRIEAAPPTTGTGDAGDDVILPGGEDEYKDPNLGSVGVGIGDPTSDPTQEEEPTPGCKFVEEVTLRGPLTKSRQWIAQNINSTLNANYSRFDVTIVEVNKDGSDGRKYTYSGCIITGYKFPSLSADSNDILEEEVSFKPERLNLG